MTFPLFRNMAWNALLHNYQLVGYIHWHKSIPEGGYKYDNTKQRWKQAEHKPDWS